MKLVRRLGIILAATMLIAALGGCSGELLDWLSAPYGYVMDASGNGISGASVQVYKTSVSDANKVQTAVTTSSTGYFTLSNKVDSQGGTYIVVVTPPTGSGLTFSNYTVTVPSSTYLFSIGNIYPDASYSISGKVVNARTKTQTTIPAAGSVEVRIFGSTTALATGTVAADGTFTVTGLDSGEYIVTYKDTAITDPWFGVPVTVEVSGGNVTGVGALVYKAAPVGSIMLIATWTRNYDIDSYSMVGTQGSATEVSYSSKTLNSGGNVVTLERDALESDASRTETTLVTSLASGTEMRFYVKCYTSTGSVSGLDAGASSVQPAGVTVYAMYQTSATAVEHFGTWFAPLNTSEKLVGIASLIGNADGSLTIGSFGCNFSSPATPRAFGSVLEYGVPVSKIE